MHMALTVSIGSALAIFEIFVSLTSLRLASSGPFGVLKYWDDIVFSEGGETIVTYTLLYLEFESA